MKETKENYKLSLAKSELKTAKEIYLKEGKDSLRAYIKRTGLLEIKEKPFMFGYSFLDDNNE